MFHFTEPRILIRKAKRKTRPTRNYKKLEQLSHMRTPLVRVNLLKGITTFKKKINPEKLARAVRMGSYGHIMETIPFNTMVEDLAPARTSLLKVMSSAAVIATEVMPR